MPHLLDLVWQWWQVEETIQSALAQLPNFEEFKSEQEKYLKYFIAIKDVGALLPRGFAESLNFRYSRLLHAHITHYISHNRN